jgi:hypothetical protein
MKSKRENRKESETGEQAREIIERTRDREECNRDNKSISR